MIDSNSIETLKQSIDIVDVIGNYIELKKSGANFKANCPFHSEKTPSFVVSPQKQIFHCFGCGAGGDAIKFVMEIEKLTYQEAVEKLASIYNITLRYTQGKSDYEELKRVLELTQSYYLTSLDRAFRAKEYLRARGVSQDSIERFKIGYAPQSKELIEFLNSRHIPLSKAEDVGVLARGKSGEYYARLQRRIIFPIHSSAGAIVGFGGRALDGNLAKYINSPQTKLFNKSRLLYGYHLAKDEIYKKKEIIVCEGYLDVIMLHQVGFKRAVATLGTALTSEHLPLLRKGEPKVILAYDGDSAGVNAALKASKLLVSNGFDGRVVLFPDGKDPADMAQSGDIKNLSSLLASGNTLIEFILETITNSYDLSNHYEKERAFLEVKEFLKSLSPITKESVIPLASQYLRVSPALFNQKDTKAINPSLKEDIAWEAILKTLLENERLIDELNDIITPNMAGDYKVALEALLRGDISEPLLQRIAINDTIYPLNEESFWQTIRVQLERFYRMRLKEITYNRNLPYQKKSYLIRKIKMDILPRLKRGELVAYESNLTI